MNRTHPHRETALWFFPVALSFAANVNVLRNGFGWDDEVIVQNLRAPDSWLQFFSPFFPGAEGPVAAFYYRPMVSVSYAVDYLLWGDNLFGFHLTVLLFHALNVFLVYGLCRTLVNLSNLSPDGGSDWANRYAPVLSACFFAVHPVHSEAVAWIPGRNDVICATFVLSSSWLFVFSSQKGGYPAYFFSMIFFFLALLTKEVAAGLLLIFPLHTFLTARKEKTTKDLRLAILQSVAFPAAIFGIYFWLRALKISRPNPAKTLEGGASLPDLGEIISAGGFYLKSMAYPFPFRPFIAGLPGEAGPAVFFALGWTGLLAWGFYRFPERKTVLGIGAVWPWVFLLPALWVFISGVAATPLADRYVYIPSAGFLIGCVVLALMGMEQLKKGRRVILRKAGPGVLFVSLTLMLGFFALESRERNRTWEDPVSFWDAAAAGAPNAAYPNEQLGIFLGRAGKLDEAERSFKRALQSNPEQERRGKILSNLGDLYSRQGRYRDAAETLRKSLKYKPEDNEILWHLGELYFQLSVVEQDPNETGVDSGRRVTRFDPDLFREGEGYFQKALALRPILFLYNRLGWKYVEFGEFEKAENHFSHVMDAGVRLDSDLGREAVRGLAAIQKERKK